MDDYVEFRIPYRIYSPIEMDQFENDFEVIRIALVSGFQVYCVNRVDKINPVDKFKILNQKYIVEGEQIMTLLIESILKSQLLVAESLIHNCGVDVNATGRVRLFGSLIDRVTPLWCAAACGHVSLMGDLIKKGAIIDKSTKSKSTPLRAACYKGSIECVEYLIQNGADINKLNKFNSSCLMIASYKGHESIVKYLLSNGANIDAKTNCGSTAMHFAAQANNINVIKLLISNGAGQFKNEQCMTPILVAAERTHLNIVHYLLAELNLTQQSMIDAYELLGASFLNDKDNYNFEEGFSALLTAMKMRCKHHSTRKQPYKKVAAYNNQIECETVEALMNLKDSHEALHYESLIIRERILGDNNPDLLPAIIYRGACYADLHNYTPCLKLWYHALQLSQNNGLSITISNDLLRFTQVFCQMIKTGFNIELSDLRDVLSSAVVELKKNQNRIAEITCMFEKEILEERMFGNMLSTLGLIIIISMTLEKECNLEHPLRKDVMEVIVELNRLNLRSKNNQTLLHLCLSYNINVDNVFTTGICCFPNYLSMKLLIFCGADVNALDSNRNTPLHYIGKFISDFPRIPHDSDDLDTKKMVIELLNAGAHTDIVNKNGVSPYAEYLKSVFTFIKNSPRSLKCLAACALKYNIPIEYYCDELPQTLLDFTELH